MAQDPLTGWMAVAVILLFGCLLVLPWASRHGVLKQSLAAGGLRLAWGLGQYLTWGLTDDPVRYDRLAVEVALGYRSPGELVTGKEAFPLLLAFQYRLFGHQPITGIVLNAVMSAAIPVLVAQICRNLDWPKAAGGAAWLVALWPPSVIFAGTLSREALVGLLLAASLWGASIARKGGLLIGIGALMVAGVSLLSARGGLALVPFVILPALLAFEAASSRSMGRVGRSAGVLAVLVGGALYMTLASNVVNEAQYFDSERIDQLSSGLDTGTLGYSGAGAAAPGSASLLSGFLGLPNAAVGPMPWHWGSLPLVVVGLEGLAWVALWYFTWVGRRHAMPRFSSLYCILPAIALLFYTAMTVTNFGVVMRIRSLELVFIAPLAVHGYQSWRHNRALRARTESRARATTHQPPAIGQ